MRRPFCAVSYPGDAWRQRYKPKRHGLLNLYEREIRQTEFGQKQKLSSPSEARNPRPSSIDLMFPQSNGLTTGYQSHFAVYAEALSKQTLSPHTRRNYLTQARQFLVFAQKLGCDSSVLLTDQNIRDEVIERYRIELRDALNVSSGSINTVLSTIKHFYRLSGKDIPEAPRERTAKSERTSLREAEVERFLEVLAKTAERDRAIVSLFYFGGLRMQECVDLDVNDIVEVEHGFTVLVGREEPRVILLGSLAAQYIDSWIKTRSATCFHASDALFLNRQGERISPSGFDQIVRKVGLRAGLVLSARLLRNTGLLVQKDSSISSDLCTSQTACQKIQNSA